MTKEQYKAFQQASQQGTPPDSLNPVFIFTLTNSALLLQIANGELDANELARFELMSRGLGITDGSFIGFVKAEEQFNSTL